MSTTSSRLGPGSTAAAFGGSLSWLIEHLVGPARHLWKTYWDHQARRATLLMLEAFDDRILKDIGLARSDVRPALFGKSDDRSSRRTSPSGGSP